MPGLSGGMSRVGTLEQSSEASSLHQLPHRPSSLALRPFPPSDAWHTGRERSRPHFEKSFVSGEPSMLNTRARSLKAVQLAVTVAGVG